MSYEEKLRNKTRELIAAQYDNIEEKKMFGGMCFMVNDKMCVCMNPERMMFRVDPDKMDELIGKDDAAPMEMKGKSMKGYITVPLETLTADKKLSYWVNLALEYNQFAKSSKKKAKAKV